MDRRTERQFDSLAQRVEVRLLKIVGVLTSPNNPQVPAALEAYAALEEVRQLRLLPRSQRSRITLDADQEGKSLTIAGYL